MYFVTIQYDPEEEMWVEDEESSVWPEDYCGGGGPFYAAAEISGLQYEHLDKLQRYQFRLLMDSDDEVKGLRFLGTEARWGEFVAATQDQMVLRNPL